MLWVCNPEIKRRLLFGRKVMTNIDSILKSRHYFANKGLSSQGYGFSSGCVYMWELDFKENWVPKNWCFWTVVLEKTLKSLLDSNEIKPVNPKGSLSWLFIGRTDVEAETPIRCPPDVKNWLIGKDPDTGKIEGRRKRRQRMRWLDGLTDSMDMSLSRLRVGVGQRCLACCCPWARKKLDMTEQLNWLIRTQKARNTEFQLAF